MQLYRLLILALLFLPSAALADTGHGPAANVMTFGAFSSDQLTTSTCTSGNTAVTVGAAKDFAKGQKVVLAHCGTNPALATPVIASVASDKWGSGGGTPYTAVADGGGTTHYCYWVVALDGAGGTSQATASTCIPDGQTPLGGDAFNAVTLTGHVTGAVAYKILQCSDVADCVTPTSFEIIPDQAGITPVFWDMGIHAGSAADPIDGLTLPGATQADNLQTSIAAMTGTAVTLADAPGTSPGGATQFAHDNQPAFAAATAQVCTGGHLIIPPGEYEMGAEWLVDNCAGILVDGGGNNGGPGGARLLNVGQAGMIGLRVNRTAASYFHDFGIIGSGHATNIAADYGVDLDIDNENASAINSGDDRFTGMTLDSGGIGLRIANKNGALNDRMTFAHLIFSNAHPLAEIFFVKANAYLEEFTSINGTNQGDFGLYSATTTNLYMRDFSTTALFGIWQGSCGFPMTFDHADTEGGNLRLYVEAAVSCQQNASFRGARKGGGLDADNHWIVTGGPLTLTDSNLSGAASTIDIYARDAGNTGKIELISQHNLWPTGSSPYTMSNGANYIAEDTIGTTPFWHTPGGSSPMPLASIGTCGAGLEGWLGTQTDSTAACSAGAAATNAGTTDCQVYCNGSDWTQTGL